MNPTRVFAVLFFLITCSLTACTSDESAWVENNGPAQGSSYHIKYRTGDGQNFESDIKDIFMNIDRSMSTYLPESLISRVNEGGVWIETDSLFMDVLSRALEISEETNGDFDVTIGPLMELWGFGSEEVRRAVPAEEIEKTKALTGYEHIGTESNRVSVPEGFYLDFNSIAQGYTVDVIARFLEERGIRDYMVEVGGEVRARGVNQDGDLWRIGVDKPETQINPEDRFQFILELDNASVATSGSYRRFWTDEETGIRYSHTINPHTGAPAMHTLLSVSIVAGSAMDADAYATVCLVRGTEQCIGFLNQKDELEGYLVYTNEDREWEVYTTEGFREFIID